MSQNKTVMAAMQMQKSLIHPLVRIPPAENFQFHGLILNLTLAPAPSQSALKAFISYPEAY